MHRTIINTLIFVIAVALSYTVAVALPIAPVGTFSFAHYSTPLERMYYWTWPPLIAFGVILPSCPVRYPSVGTALSRSGGVLGILLFIRLVTLAPIAWLLQYLDYTVLHLADQGSYSKELLLYQPFSLITVLVTCVGAFIWFIYWRLLYRDFPLEQRRYVLFVIFIAIGIQLTAAAQRPTLLTLAWFVMGTLHLALSQYLDRAANIK